jgi:PAS domain-containing protein
MDISAPPHDCHVPEELAATLREALNALLDVTGATAGWIGLLRPDGQLHFPARVGTFSEAWLTLQQGQNSIWGFEVREGPTVLNDPAPLAILGSPPLRNLLSCLLRRGASPAGQLVLANKMNGFTSHDDTALRTMALFLSGRLVHESNCPEPPLSAALSHAVLDHIQEGILIVDHTGRLVFANASWAQWTGYSIQELCNRQPPFPFWVSHTELAALSNLGPILPGTLFPSQGSGAHGSGETATPREPFPFRHRNHSLFWCQMETTTAEVAGQAVTIVFLSRVPAAAHRADNERTSSPDPMIALPGSATNSRTPTPGGAASREADGMALLVRPGGFIDLWDERWEELTGLKHRDVAGISTELFLDWLFPRQPDRSFVADLFHQPGRHGAQAILEVAGRTGNRSLLFTFLPVRALDVRAAMPATGKEPNRSLASAPMPVGDAWLILAWPRDVTAVGASRTRRFCKARAAELASSFVAGRKSPVAK